MRQDLIERVKKGEAWIHYGRGLYGTLEQLQTLLIECFPNDKCSVYGLNNYYYTDETNKGESFRSNQKTKRKQTNEVSEFFQAELTFQRAKVLSGKKESYKYSLTERSLVFWRKPFTPCPEVDVPQTVIEALQSDNSQTIVIGGFIYKI